jgi:hypothetical protein
MPCCAFLSMDSLDGFQTSDHLLAAPMAVAGWRVAEVSWRDPHVDWARFEAVVVRTPWDYVTDVTAFIAVLEAIDRAPTRLANDRALMVWNLDKTYLRALTARGVPIVPTLWADTYDAAQTAHAFAHFDTDEIVVKPVVAAGACDTFRLDRATLAREQDALATTFAARPHMIQPFVETVITSGEISLFYFGGRYSHAIRKVPKSGDFRVQEEHGGILTALMPDPVVRSAGDAVMQALDATPLYARVDLVWWQGAPVLIECELVEPSLYLDFAAAAPQRFVDAFLDWYAAPIGSD